MHACMHQVGEMEVGGGWLVGCEGDGGGHVGGLLDGLIRAPNSYWKS
jgi:hypothetical protein